MTRFFILLFILASTCAWSAPQLIIKNKKQYPFDQKNLEKQFQTAYEYFAKEIGELEGDIVVTISPESCLRTGFNRSNHEVEFCPGKKVINAGLSSVDVINHELFHSFLCHHDDSLCDMKEKDYLHEALADTFAYYLNTDDVFGEDFYKNQVYLRKYLTTTRPGLVQGEHEKGNALSSIFIKSEVPFAKLLPLFHEEDPKEEVQDIITGAPESRLNRYRLPLNQSMQIEFQFAEEARVERVEWTVPEGVVVQKTALHTFDIKITSDPETSKGFAVFLSDDGQELGRRTFYFGIKKN
jgi:hypothetical protein